MQSSKQCCTYLPCNTCLSFQFTHVLFLFWVFIFVLLRGLGHSGKMPFLELLDLRHWRYINKQCAEARGC